MEYLILEIEKKRYDLLISAKTYGLKSEKTIQLSQELDELLNTYNNAIKRLASEFVQHNAM